MSFLDMFIRDAYVYVHFYSKLPRETLLDWMTSRGLFFDGLYHHTIHLMVVDGIEWTFFSMLYNKEEVESFDILQQQIFGDEFLDKYLGFAGFGVKLPEVNMTDRECYNNSIEDPESPMTVKELSEFLKIMKRNNEITRNQIKCRTMFDEIRRKDEEFGVESLLNLAQKFDMLGGSWIAFPRSKCTMVDGVQHFEKYPHNDLVDMCYTTYEIIISNLLSGGLPSCVNRISYTQYDKDCVVKISNAVCRYLENFVKESHSANELDLYRFDTEILGFQVSEVYQSINKLVPTFMKFKYKMEVCSVIGCHNYQPLDSVKLLYKSLKPFQLRGEESYEHRRRNDDKHMSVQNENTEYQFQRLSF